MSGSQATIQAAFTNIVGTTVASQVFAQMPTLLNAAANALPGVAANVVAQNAVEGIFHSVLGRDPSGTLTAGVWSSQELQDVTALYLSGLSLAQLQGAFATGSEVAGDLQTYYSTVFNHQTLAASALSFWQQLLTTGNPSQGDAETPTLAQAELGIVGQYRIQATYNDLYLVDGTYSNGETVNQWLRKNGDGTSLSEIVYGNVAGILSQLANTPAAKNFVRSLAPSGGTPTSAQVATAKAALASGASNSVIAAVFNTSSLQDPVWFGPSNVMVAPPPSGTDVNGVWGQWPSGATIVPDLLSLFSIGGGTSPLPSIAPGRSTFEIGEQEALWFSNSTLSSIFQYLNTNGIALSLQTALAPDIHSASATSSDHEGYAPLNAEIPAIQRIYQDGGQLQYLAMDEPLAGNLAPAGPEYDPATLANLIAINVKDVEAYFPNVQIGDIEPVGNDQQLTVSQIEQFANDYQTATGQKLAFLRADIQWASPTWEQDLQQLAAYCRAQGISLQVIYDAGLRVDPQYLPPNTALLWAEQALEGMAAIEADPLIRPDAGIISSWDPYPATALPVNSDGSLTYLEQQYANIAPLYRALPSGTGNVTPAAITAPIALSAPLGQAIRVSGVSIALPATITSNPTLQVILTAADGVLKVSGSASVTGNGSSGLVLTGTQVQINGALSTLTYTRRVAGPDLLQIASVGQDPAGDNPLSQLFIAIDNSVANGITIAGNGNGFSATVASLYQISGDNDLVNVGSVVSAATTVDGDNNTISAAPGATFSVIGDSATLLVQGGDTLNVTGTNETFVLSGSNNIAVLMSNTVNLNINAGGVGGALTVTSPNAGTRNYFNVITLSGAVAVTIDNEAYITVNHAVAGDVINIGTGDAQWLDINGGGATVNLSCSMQQVNASGETIAAAAGLSFNMAGTADSLVEGAHDVVNVGSATMVANGTTTVVASGNDSFVLSSGAYLGLLGGTGFSILANGGTVATWANTSFSLGGSNNTINAAAGDMLNLTGTGGSFSYYNTVNLGGPATVTISNEAYVTINHAAAGDVINVGTGDAQWLDINGGGATVNLSSSIQLNASGETVTAAAGLSFNMAGTADSLVEGANDVVNVGSATVITNGVTTVVTSGNDSFVLNSGAYLGLLGGNGFSVTANGGTVATWANTGLTLSGSGDQVSLGNSSQLGFISSAGAVGFDTGSKDRFAITATSTAQTVSGFNMSNGDILDLTGILASSQLAHDLSNIGNYLSVTSSGANTTITITGAAGSDTVQLPGSGALTLSQLLSGGAFKLPSH